MSNPGNQFDNRNTSRSAGLPVCYEVDDADFAVPANNGPGAVVYVNNITATRTITLPSIDDVPFGWSCEIKDAQGLVTGAIHLMVACAGSETIDNTAPVDLHSPFCYIRVRRRGPLNAKFDSDQFAWSVFGEQP